MRRLRQQQPPAHTHSRNSNAIWLCHPAYTHTHTCNSISSFQPIALLACFVTEYIYVSVCVCVSVRLGDAAGVDVDPYCRCCRRSAANISVFLVVSLTDRGASKGRPFLCWVIQEIGVVKWNDWLYLFFSCIHAYKYMDVRICTYVSNNSLPHCCCGIIKAAAISYVHSRRYMCFQVAQVSEKKAKFYFFYCMCVNLRVCLLLHKGWPERFCWKFLHFHY